MHWGLIGASTIASECVIGAIRATDGQKIRSVMSSDAARGAEYARKHDIPHSTTSLEEIVGDPEIRAVYVSTTNEKHFPQAMAAIAAGKHVLCEKPLAMSVAEAAEMTQAAKDAGLVFATNHHLRCAGSHIAVRNLIADGRIGKVLSMRVFHAVQLPHLQGWRINDAAAGGGVIPDITVHDADIVRFHLGEDPVEVVARVGASGLGAGVEDSVMSVWSMPSGAMVMSHESFTHPFAGSGIEVHGTEGSIAATGVMTQRPVGEVWLTDAEGRHRIPFDTHDLYARTLHLFVEATKGDGQPAATGVDGLKSLAVALAVREAAQRGLATRVEYAGL